jgi:multidrug efflux pump subunit AcrB
VLRGLPAFGFGRRKRTLREDENVNPIIFAMRRPLTVVVAIIGVVLAALAVVRPKWVDDSLKRWGLELPIRRMAIDIFPALDLPVIYVCQPYGGMDPAQMEGLLTNYYEYHFLYITGIHHVESRNVQGTALMKLVFHAGTNMAQAMAETINYVNRSRAFMPPGTVSPFVMRFDTGSVPVGYLVLSSPTRTVAEIQDQALFKVRPMFAALPGVSAPPPFGGSARSIVVRCDPQKLLAYQMSAEEVVTALTQGNTVSPSGNLRLGDHYPIVPTNAMVKDIRDLGDIPVREGVTPAVYLKDVAVIEDAADLTTGYALVNGRRAVYILATKRADASTMSVIEEIKTALPRMQRELPEDIRVTFEFDQSPYVTRAISSLRAEGLLGAALTGLMVLLFLRDWRSAVVVVINIPLAILAAVLGLWLCGQTINLMTLGGLALAVGILVDEATVEIENIHSQMSQGRSIAIAVRAGNLQTAVPRFLAMMCMLAVFVPSFFMEGAARALFVPLSLAVGFSMIASYLLSSTFVPVMATWLLRPAAQADAGPKAGAVAKVRSLYERAVQASAGHRTTVILAYLAACGLVLYGVGGRLGMEIFPAGDAGEFRLRLRAPDGTHIDRTEQLALDALEIVKQKVGQQKVDLTLGYVGTVPSSYPINGVYQWSRGPEEAILRIKLRDGSGVNTESMKELLREELARSLPGLRLSFEPADIVSEVMSFGSPTPIEIAARSTNLEENRKFIKRVWQALAQLPGLRDLQISQSLDYPTVEVKVKRDVAGKSGVTMSQVARSVVAATSSSRFVVPNYWPDPKTGIGYQVQVEIPQPAMRSLNDLATLPVLGQGQKPVLLRDVAQIGGSTMPGQFDRYNMKREIALTGNIAGTDLGTVAGQVTSVLEEAQRADDAEKEALEKAGGKPVRVTHELRGQIPPMRSMTSGLGVGLLLAVLVIFLMLTANFQSVGLALVTVSPVPVVVCGAVLMLLATGGTLNIQSFIGTIMAIGVAMANSILLVTFAESARRGHGDAPRAAVEGASSRLRPILMTSCAMIAGMAPMALGLGEAGQQTAPLGRAVVGGLAAATTATLLVLPAVFAFIQKGASRQSASLDPDDPNSRYYQPAPVQPVAATP